jgi:hypothetical protein
MAGGCRSVGVCAAESGSGEGYACGRVEGKRVAKLAKGPARPKGELPELPHSERSL